MTREEVIERELVKLRAEFDRFKSQVRCFDVSDQPYCEVTRSTVQAIPNATHTDISFDTETSDKWGMWAAGSPTRITCVVPGVYIVSAGWSFVPNAAGRRQSKMRHYNSSGVAIEYVGQSMFLTVGGGYADYCGPSGIVVLAAGDYLVATPWQDSGGALNINAYPTMRAQWIRPAP